MSDDKLREAILALDKQEQDLFEAAKKIEDQLIRVRNARTGLAALLNEEPLPFDGNLTSAVRVVLFNSTSPKQTLKPVQVRDAVKAMGFTFREEQNQMAAVHGVLKRLVESKEALTKDWSKEPGIIRYYWNPDAPPPQGKLIPLSGSPRFTLREVLADLIGQGAFQKTSDTLMEDLNLKPRIVRDDLNKQLEEDAAKSRARALHKPKREDGE